jgi:Kef-type K+ transport system membrane component KefB
MHTEGTVIILASIAVVLVAAKLGAEVFERLGQPAVLGELLAGMAGGWIIRVASADVTRSIFDAGSTAGSALDLLATIGIVLLIFDAGLESTIADMRRVGSTSMLVAIVGVVVPLVLGMVVASLFVTTGAGGTGAQGAVDPFVVQLFIGATLAATSVGITARVFKELNVASRPEARIVMGAAVIDDILGLVLLAVVAGLVSHPGVGTLVTTAMEVSLTALAVLLCALLVGRFVVPGLVRRASVFRTEGMSMFVALSLCFAFAALTGAFGLSPIVGAFAAGLVLEDAHFSSYRGEKDIRKSVAPVMRVFAPVFFVWTGAQVDLRLFADPHVLVVGAALSAAAISGKQACSLVVPRGLQRGIVGLAMIPRGEVGLMFASVGRTLGVLSDSLFAAIVLVVLVTTIITPPFLSRALRTQRAT